MSSNALYTDLSGYYDLLCADIDYQAQSHSAQRLHQLFGNGGNRYLDLACGTGPHVRYFMSKAVPVPDQFHDQMRQAWYREKGYDLYHKYRVE